VKSRLVLPIGLAFVVLAGCSGDDDAATTEPTAPTTEVTPTTQTVSESTSPTSQVPEITAAPTTAPPSSTPVATAPSTTEAAPPFTPLPPGEYEVGVTTVVLDDPDRPLTVDIWFPLVAIDELVPHQYTLLPGVYYESPDAFTATADQLADGTFPLVIYSHGSGGLRYIDSALTETIASHGYVVAASDHTGNTAVDRLLAGIDDEAPDDTTEPTEEEIRQFEQIGIDRANDVDRLIDALTDPGSAAGPFATQVDAEHIAVAGHSAGGSTATGMTIGITNDTGTFPPDERVDAIVLLAPAVGFTDDELATVDVPMMSIVGTADDITPAGPNATRLWDLSSQSPAYRVEFEDAGHYAFTDICAYQAAVPTLPNVPQPIVDLIDSYAENGCAADSMPPERADELTDTYVITFLDEVLRGGPSVIDATGTPPDDVTVFEAR
jgi:predicted dienelactone hydrolase